MVYRYICPAVGFRHATAFAPWHAPLAESLGLIAIEGVRCGARDESEYSAKGVDIKLYASVISIPRMLAVSPGMSSSIPSMTR